MRLPARRPRDAAGGDGAVRLPAPARLGTAYAGAYGREELQRWADACRSWAADEFGVRVYFNNDLGGAAVRDAVTLRNLVGQRVAWSPPRESEPGTDESNGRLAG